MTRQLVPTRNRILARTMRSAMTEPELTLWLRIRNRALSGLRFRRQVPLGSYIVDFACLSHRLVVEVDGGQHCVPSVIASDLRRSEWLAREGFRILRVSNRDIRENMDGVCSAIMEAAGVETGVAPPPENG